MTTDHLPQERLLTQLRRHRVVPVVTIDEERDAVPLARALVAGGLPVAEVTFRTTAAADSLGAITDAGLTEATADRPPLLVGAGTVTNTRQVDDAVAAGAEFIITPGLDRSVVERCLEHGVPVVPGVATATEVQAALGLGLRTVKFFPAAASGGAAAVRALAGPFPQTWFIPTGGIDASNLQEYLAIPAVPAAGGSWMLPSEHLAARDFNAITEATARAVALAQKTPR